MLRIKKLSQPTFSITHGNICHVHTEDDVPAGLGAVTGSGIDDDILVGCITPGGGIGTLIRPGGAAIRKSSFVINVIIDYIIR